MWQNSKTQIVTKFKKTNLHTKKVVTKLNLWQKLYWVILVRTTCFLDNWWDVLRAVFNNLAMFLYYVFILPLRVWHCFSEQVLPCFFSRILSWKASSPELLLGLASELDTNYNCIYSPYVSLEFRIHTCTRRIWPGKCWLS